ncbi:MAG: Fic family protein [Bacteroidota bacterium]
MKVYNFELDFNWELVRAISALDRFDASWNSIEKKEGSTLKQLKSIATVRSVGASTRIEGSKMSNEEVDVLLTNLSIDKLTERDAQEVAGYFEALDIISESYQEIQITENEIKNLHNILLKYGDKDQWHKGDYKQHSNNVEASLPDGTKQLIFETTPPGFETDDAMRALCAWYQNDDEVHELVKCALFSYEFVSIHPFQDGNGRLSRLFASLLLLKCGYRWIQYVSLEHEIESRKPEYYRVLRTCQARRPNEDITPWIGFFFDALRNIQEQLTSKLERTGATAKLSPREIAILTYISDHSGCKSGEIAVQLNIPSPTVKRILSKLLNINLIGRQGTGRSISYYSN